MARRPRTFHTALDDAQLAELRATGDLRIVWRDSESDDVVQLRIEYDPDEDDEDDYRVTDTLS